MVSLVCQPCRHRADRIGDPVCPFCHEPMAADLTAVPPPPDGFARFDHTYTPGHARTILEAVPADSFHWADIERKAPEAVATYTALMLQGRWRDETLARGYWEHPVDFDAAGVLQHGAMRLLACAASGRPFAAVTLCPIGLLPEVFSWPPST